MSEMNQQKKANCEQLQDEDLNRKERVSSKRKSVKIGKGEDGSLKAQPTKANKKQKKGKKNVKLEAYDPSKPDYNPEEDSNWKRGENVPYMSLCRTFEKIEGVPSRLKKIEYLVNFFLSVILLTPKDLLLSIYLCLNKLAPDYEGVEIGFGEQLIMKVLSFVMKKDVNKIRKDYEKKGDLGLVVEGSMVGQRMDDNNLCVEKVFNTLKQVAHMSGNQAETKKLETIQHLLSNCAGLEARYLVRSLVGKLRTGLAEKTLLVSLTAAIVLAQNPQNKRGSVPFKKQLRESLDIVQTTHNECPNYDIIVELLLNHQIEELPKYCALFPGIPIKPMLAHPTKGIGEILNRFNKNPLTCEYKYDGERAQIHLSENGKVQVYSRNHENNTSKYPDIVTRIPLTIKHGVKSFIIDCEVVAWERETKQILPFQILSNRRRKNAKEEDIKVNICLFVFDILYLNGQSLVKHTFRGRRTLLHDSFTEIDGMFMFAKSSDVQTTEEMQDFFEESIKGRCEGLMVKSLEANYEIAKRSYNWLKLKKDYLDGVGDTLDVVVLGGYHGKGRRAGTFGGYLLACYDEKTDKYQTICKIGTGFTDDDLAKFYEYFKNHTISKPKLSYSFNEHVKPDVWFDALQVWEIKCADLSISPVHMAGYGVVEQGKGISLRFPRFICMREDKKPEEATTASQVVEMYGKQANVGVL